jgi:hypothetical protein
MTIIKCCVDGTIIAVLIKMDVSVIDCKILNWSLEIGDWLSI